MEYLKSKRTSLRVQNTRIIDEACFSSLTTRDQLTSMHERLKANKDELRSLNNEIEQHILNEEFEAECNAVIEHEDNATRILAELLSKKSLITQSSPVVQGTFAQAVAAPSDGTGVKLPKLIIAPFSGDLLKWAGFWEQLVRIVYS
ncbi:hypothetical protein HPB50_013697 [Hyalomma asiaticum]|uniref:Uncharacterized protein n=1 Tax=Hyalomma asiaticum TaxID=266040 RepID=A0ACB7RPS9_HYAAI|nr:hypothetical protein HPB50_013697 [Hyalomma asiaticum]